MKKALLFSACFLMLINSNISAQSYHPLIRPNTYWDVQFTDGSICDLSGGIQYFFQGDTIISGITYNKVYGLGIVAVNPGPYCPPYAIDTNQPLLYFFMREDTTEKKVYKIGLHDTVEDLYYDFSLEHGDTLKSNYAYMFGSTYIVDSVDWISLNNGELRKRFRLNNGEYYVESIGGGSKGFAQYINNTFGGASIQECVNENGVQLWYYDPCFGTLGIEQHRNDLKFEISPNPFTTSAQINFNQTYKTIALEVYDIEGKLLLQNHYTDCKQIELKRGNLSEGLYFLKITLDGNKVETRKIVVSY